jgi:hypothetical protein
MGKFVLALADRFRELDAKLTERKSKRSEADDDRA